MREPRGSTLSNGRALSSSPSNTFVSRTGRKVTRGGARTNISGGRMLPPARRSGGNTKIRRVRDNGYLNHTYRQVHPELDEIPDYDDEYDDMDSLDGDADGEDDGHNDHPSPHGSTPSLHGSNPSPYGSNVGVPLNNTFHQKPQITVVGKRFAKNAVHRSIRAILNEHYDGPWAVYGDIPKDVLSHMFECFRSRWSWYPEVEKRVNEAFKFVLKERFRDFVSNMRKKALQQARDGGEMINENNKFAVMVKYPPSLVTPDVWKKLCLIWGSNKWGKKSECGKKNRASADSSGKSSRHTGGSIRFDEHRIALERKLGRKPTFKELFLHTHLTKEAKKNFWDGELNCDSLDGGAFCTARSKEAYEEYVEKLIELHGPNPEQPDDEVVWTNLNGDKFGIGSSDSGFVINGKESTSFASPPLQEALKKSQDEVRDLRAQLETQKEDMETKLENERKAREDAQQLMQENWEKQMAELKRQVLSSDNQQN